LTWTAQCRPRWTAGAVCPQVRLDHARRAHPGRARQIRQRVEQRGQCDRRRIIGAPAPVAAGSAACLCGQFDLVLGKRVICHYHRTDQERRGKERADRAPQPCPERQRQKDQERAQRQLPSDDVWCDEMTLQRRQRDEEHRSRDGLTE
jgi:hypothetical protein